MWQHVKRFLENPGELLEHIREQHKEETDGAEEVSARRDDLARRLAAKQAEKDRYVRLYAQGHISEEELETYLLDLKNQVGNLKLLIEAAEADLSGRQRAELADTTRAWLATLRERISEVEEDTPSAFEKRRELAKLLVEKITVDRSEDGQPRVKVTCRFDPTHDAAQEHEFVSGMQNSCEF